MFMWVVYFKDYEDLNIVGIYSDEEKAKKAMLVLYQAQEQGVFKDSFWSSADVRKKYVPVDALDLSSIAKYISD